MAHGVDELHTDDDSISCSQCETNTSNLHQHAILTPVRNHYGETHLAFFSIISLFYSASKL